ncbi:MAG: DNA cytosine methyltransferase [Blastochloris sp.]|nr:DNA cytosine methyltransferase [Blastochloris sp.]
MALFAGAGGLSAGFAAAGCKPSVAADVDADAAQTYGANHGVTCHVLDLARLDADGRKALRLDDPAFAVIGGPPCQGFSTAGGRNAADPRNKLVFSYLDIVKLVQPRWFLFENVEGILTSNNGASVQALLKRFIDLGYWVRLDKLNFAAYGLPQARKRVVLIGNRVGVNIPLPLPTHSFNSGKHKSVSMLPFSPTLNEALAGLGSALRGKTHEVVRYASSEPLNAYDQAMRQGNVSGEVSLHFWMASEKDLGRLRHLKPGQTMKDLPQELWHDSYRRRAFRRVLDGTPTEKRGGAPSGLKRLVGDLNSLTITGSAHREFIHPDEDRPLTIREAARLQSFPDKYVFFGKPERAAVQIGNAFPPMVARTLAEHLMYLDGSFGSDRMPARAFGPPRLLGFTLTEAAAMSPALAEADWRLRSLCRSAEEQLSLLVS